LRLITRVEMIRTLLSTSQSVFYKQKFNTKLCVDSGEVCCRCDTTWDLSGNVGLY